MANKKAARPLDVRLTLVVNFGDTDDERVLLVDDRRLAMVGSIFAYRDRIARFMTRNLLRAAMLQPKVAARLLPGLPRRAGKKSEN